MSTGGPKYQKNLFFRNSFELSNISKIPKMLLCCWIDIFHQLCSLISQSVLALLMLTVQVSVAFKLTHLMGSIAVVYDHCLNHKVYLSGECM